MNLPFAPNLSIDGGELAFRFIQASGPGGQNVNKLATAVQLRFDAAHSPSLPDHVKARLAGLAGTRMTNDGTIVITARRFRSQEQNRADAVARLLQLLAKAASPRAPRRPTRPSTAQRKQRLADKSRRAGVKRTRQTPSED